MPDIENDGTEKLREFWIKLKGYKRLYKIIDLIGNICFIIMIVLNQWFIAFLLFIIFFPDEVDIIRFLKKLFKSTHSFKYEE